MVTLLQLWIGFTVDFTAYISQKTINLSRKTLNWQYPEKVRSGWSHPRMLINAYHSVKNSAHTTWRWMQHIIIPGVNASFIAMFNNAPGRTVLGIVKIIILGILIPVM